jgi:hypothetical protein
MQQLVDTGHLTRPQLQGVGPSAKGVRKSGNIEHQLSRFVARIACAMAEMHARSTQRSGAAQNGRADALNGFRGCVG